MSQQDNNTPTTGAPAIEDKALDKESVIEMLGEDDQEQETLELEKDKGKDKKDKVEGDKKTAKEGEETPEGEETELSLEDELEDELKEPDETELELLEPPRRKEILAAYPDLFKKFPSLERSMYREQKYSEILPTLEDAQNASDKAQLLDNYEKEIYGGSTETLLATVRENDKEAYAKIVDNYLPTLYKVDQQSYYHTIGNVIKHTIISMVRDGKENSNEELESAAAVLNNYMFGTTKFTHPTNLSKDDVQDDGSRKKEDEISQRERDFVERQFNSARDDLGGRVDNILKASVDRAIDPNESMTGYVKEIATQKVLDGLEDLIRRDTRFSNLYDRLWEKAFESEFNRESMDRIKSAYLSKAKTLLPLLINKERKEALKGTRRTSNDDEKDRKGPLPVGKTRSSTTLASGRANSGNNSNKQIPRGMSTLEFLNSDD